ncbi:MAG TPA: hypothetical protein VGB37_05275 [Candidatus Lokiarchaeia archaeon]
MKFEKDKPVSSYVSINWGKAKYVIAGIVIGIIILIYLYFKLFKK